MVSLQGEGRTTGEAQSKQNHVYGWQNHRNVILAFFFFSDVKIYSVSTKHVIHVIQRFIQQWWLISWPARESFSLPKAQSSSNLANREKKILIESWVAWIALPTYYSHTRCFTALQNSLALPTVGSRKLLSRSEKHKIFFGQQWNKSAVFVWWAAKSIRKFQLMYFLLPSKRENVNTTCC